MIYRFYRLCSVGSAQTCVRTGLQGLTVLMKQITKRLISKQFLQKKGDALKNTIKYPFLREDEQWGWGMGQEGTSLSFQVSAYRLTPCLSLHTILRLWACSSSEPQSVNGSFPTITAPACCCTESQDSKQGYSLFCALSHLLLARWGMNRVWNGQGDREKCLGGRNIGGRYWDKILVGSGRDKIGINWKLRFL